MEDNEEDRRNEKPDWESLKKEAREHEDRSKKNVGEMRPEKPNWDSLKKKARDTENKIKWAVLSNSQKNDSPNKMDSNNMRRPNPGSFTSEKNKKFERDRYVQGHSQTLISESNSFY